MRDAGRQSLSWRGGRTGSQCCAKRCAAGMGESWPGTLRVGARPVNAGSINTGLASFVTSKSLKYG